MSTIAAGNPRSHPFRPRPWMLVTGITVASLVASVVARRLQGPLPYPIFQGACERLRASGLPVTPQDWFCRPVPRSMQFSFVAALTLMGVAYALPSAILASTGRRGTALLPLVVAPAALNVFTNFVWLGPGITPGPSRMELQLLLLAAPVVAISVVSSSRRVRRARPRLLSAVATTIVTGAASMGAVWAARWLMSNHFASLGGMFFGYSFIVPGAFAIAAFGVLLGPDRRWWPWSLVPVAVLLSMGPSLALVVGPEGTKDWSQFGVAAPLMAIGLIWSAWRPLGLRLDRVIYRGAERAVVDDQRGVDGRSERVRPAVALNAAATAVAVISLIVFRADPLPIQEGTVLPTFLGERVAVQDLRARMNLRLAMSALETYRQRTGSYQGFDAKTGTAAEPSLAWLDGIPRGSDPTNAQALTVSIVTASGRRAQVAALSDSGNAFCLERTASGSLRYEKAVHETQAYGPPVVPTLRAAVQSCGAIPWTPQAIRPFPIETMCDGMAPYSGYLICRMVQVLSLKVTQETKPA